MVLLLQARQVPARWRAPHHGKPGWQVSRNCSWSNGYTRCVPRVALGCLITRWKSYGPRSLSCSVRATCKSGKSGCWSALVCAFLRPDLRLEVVVLVPSHTIIHWPLILHLQVWALIHLQLLAPLRSTTKLPWLTETW